MSLGNIPELKSLFCKVLLGEQKLYGIWLHKEVELLKNQRSIEVRCIAKQLADLKCLEDIKGQEWWLSVGDNILL